MIDRQSLKLFLDQVFTTTAVAAPDVYIASAVAQARRSLNHGDARSIPPRSHDLDDWLQASSLGPYETKLLATLVHAPGPVIVLRGGTGSGKSSVLGYLTRHVAAAAARLPADTNRFSVPSLLRASGRADLSCRQRRRSVRRQGNWPNPPEHRKRFGSRRGNDRGLWPLEDSRRDAQ